MWTSAAPMGNGANDAARRRRGREGRCGRGRALRGCKPLRGLGAAETAAAMVAAVRGSALTKVSACSASGNPACVVFSTSTSAWTSSFWLVDRHVLPGPYREGAGDEPDQTDHYDCLSGRQHHSRPRRQRGVGDQPLDGAKDLRTKPAAGDDAAPVAPALARAASCTDAGLASGVAAVAGSAALSATPVMRARAWCGG